MGWGALLSQEHKSQPGLDLEHNQILQRVVTGQEAQVSRVTTAFPLMPSQPPSSRAQLWETQRAAGSLLPSPRMPVGLTLWAHPLQLP